MEYEKLNQISRKVLEIKIRRLEHQQTIDRLINWLLAICLVIVGAVLMKGS